MPRYAKYLLVFVVILFILACSTVTQPFKDVKGIAGTAESLATAMPLETLKAMASQIPVSTLEALPSALPDLEDFFNPQGTPASDWQGIPIMPQATAGQEFPKTHTYSFKTDATKDEVKEFYSTKLKDLGWSSLFSLPGQSSGDVEAFQKDNSLLTLTIVDRDGSVVVILTKP